MGKFLDIAIVATTDSVENNAAPTRTTSEGSRIFFFRLRAQNGADVLRHWTFARVEKLLQQFLQILEAREGSVIRAPGCREERIDALVLNRQNRYHGAYRRLLHVVAQRFRCCRHDQDANAYCAEEKVRASGRAGGRADGR